MAVIQVIEVRVWGEAIAAIGVKGQRAVIRANTRGEGIAGNGAVDIGCGRDLTVEDGVLIGADACTRSNGSIVDAINGDGDGGWS